MPLLLIAVFIVVPLVELYVIIEVAGSIGVVPTIVLLLLDSIVGSILLRSQGRAAWVRFNRALAESRVPHKEVLDGVLIIFGGALLLTPGFITDIFGLVLLIPPTRALVRAFLTRLVAGRVIVGGRAASWGYSRMRGRRAPPGTAETPGQPPPTDQPRPAPAAEDFSWEAPPSPPADIEGTAQEVRDEDESLPPGERGTFPG